ncbi:MAG: GTPase domain-containing protein, partial [Candidatus Njordarchaeota archaeon]
MANLLKNAEAYRLNVALFGPSGSGKSLFRRILFTGKYSPTRPNRRAIEKEIPRIYRFEIKITGNLGETKYILHLIDVPGKEDLVEERESVLKKISGYIFFYDSTDVKSVELLEEMIKKEIEEKKKMKSALAVVLVGTKKDKGPDEEAIKKGCYLVDYLSRITVPYFGYRVPHLLISCKNRDEVNMAFNCLESIMFETRPNKDIIEKIGIVHKKVTDFIILEPLEGLEEISRSIETMAKKAASKTPVAGHVTTSITLKKISSVSVEKTTYMTRMKGIEAEKELAEFKLFQNPKMWNLAKAVEVLLPGIQECIIINKK